MIQFFIILKDYLLEVLPSLAIGFFLSGLIYEFIPQRWVERYLSGGGIKPILYSTLIGTALPLCCIADLPVALSLCQKGARLGPVLAFLVATPATSISALLVTYALLGLEFTLFIFLAVIFMGLVIGLVGNRMRVRPRASLPMEGQAIDLVCGMSVPTGKAVKTEYGGEVYYFCCSHCRVAFENSPEEYLGAQSRSIAHRLRRAFKYAFVDIVREIGPELLLGLALAALVAAIAPIGKFVGSYLTSGLGYLFSLILGILMYICATASVPLVDALVNQGMNIGAGMVLLIVGPVTSWGTILVVRKEFGNKTLVIYLGLISILALALGWCFSMI